MDSFSGDCHDIAEMWVILSVLYLIVSVFSGSYFLLLSPQALEKVLLRDFNSTTSHGHRLPGPSLQP